MIVMLYNIFYHNIVLIFYLILATIYQHYWVSQSSGFIALGLLFLKNYKINLSFSVKLGRKHFSFSKGQDVLYEEDNSLSQLHIITYGYK